MEQPQLGVSHVGIEAAQFSLSWTWELGWSLRAATRLSGATGWSGRDYIGLSAEEAHQILQDVAAEALGLV